uniref:RNA-directed DNA polymerase, eukaryota n=1 Tax=Tanacetum cinerariifolium TaxID=118510 RepID=A0A699GRC2_TANCI|nr:hypothetical protein [Tanacetum cinerariifolium]
MFLGDPAMAEDSGGEDVLGGDFSESSNAWENVEPPLCLSLGLFKKVNHWDNHKRDWIKEIIAKNSLLFVGIQETKIETLDDSLIRYLWPNNFTAFVANGSMGASGGILTMWDSRVFLMELNVIDSNFVGVIGSWVGVSNRIGLINVYSPQASLQKGSLWLSIEAFISSHNVTRIIF